MRKKIVKIGQRRILVDVIEDINNIEPPLIIEPLERTTKDKIKKFKKNISSFIDSILFNDFTYKILSKYFKE